MDFHRAVTHEQFMQRALYDPEEGYYARQVKMGGRGDFSTSATLCPAFAEAIAGWVRAAAERLQLGTPCPVIELGPGDGSLALALRDALGQAFPLHLVEASPPLRERQLERLGRCQHAVSLKGALEACGGRALILANEFVDAFPAIQLCWKQGQWWEVGVQFGPDGLPQECLMPFQRAIDAEALAHPRDGQRIFIHPAYHDWLRHNLPALKQGAFLCLDYGADYPAGECRAYAGQERYEGLAVYLEAGRRDLTCDVNFSDLKRWMEALGLRTCFHGSQRAFLQAHLEDFEARVREDRALDFISRPLGAGEAFRVLEMERP